MRRLLAAFHPPAPRPDLEQDPAVVARAYRHWRVRVMYSLLIGYALFYFCRKNMPGALASMGRELHYSNSRLADLNALLYITYGVGKFVNGALGDHANPRLFLSAGANIAFGASSGFNVLLLLWGLNGWFQSMGFPPCARLLSHWYSPSERGLFWSIWNSSHQIGGALILVLSGVLAEHYGWRSCFVVPGLICVLGGLFLYERVRDTPAALGLPPVGHYRGERELEADGSEVSEEPETLRQVLWNRVLRSPAIWLISVLNLFVYLVRAGVFDWTAKFLIEHKGASMSQAGLVTSAFEVLGIPGSILAGVLSDRLGGGRRAPVCALFLLCTAGAVALLYAIPPGHPLLDGLALALIGLFLYGPQFLVGVFAVDMASRKGAATAIGLTGVLGYAGSALSSKGTGVLVDRYGWGGGFAFWIGGALCGALLALPLWGARARVARA
jgi:sugar phosphate permease